MKLRCGRVRDVAVFLTDGRGQVKWAVVGPAARRRCHLFTWWRKLMKACALLQSCHSSPNLRDDVDDAGRGRCRDPRRNRSNGSDPEAELRVMEVLSPFFPPRT